MLERAYNYWVGLQPIDLHKVIDAPKDCAPQGVPFYFVLSTAPPFCFHLRGVWCKYSVTLCGVYPVNPPHILSLKFIARGVDISLIDVILEEHKGNNSGITETFIQSPSVMPHFSTVSSPYYQIIWKCQERKGNNQLPWPRGLYDLSEWWKTQ